MRKFHIILLMTLGFLLSPAVSFACGQKDSARHKEAPAKKDCTKDCCKEKKQSLPCGEKHKDCDGKCGHSSCHCPSFSAFGFGIVPFEEYKYSFFGSDSRYVRFGYAETFFTSAIASLRLPPKIG